MPGLISIEFKVISNKLPALPGRITSEVNTAVEKTGDKTVDFAHSTVPVDTGQLRTSIHRTDNAVNGWVTIMAGGAAAFYAGYVEFGTVKMAARPYMSPAAQFAKQILPDAVRDAVARAIAGGGGAAPALPWGAS